MSEELKVLIEVTRRLDQGKIAYVISGSIAANYYTVPRMTRDIDVVIEMKMEEVGLFIHLFQGDFFVDEDMVKAEVQKRGMFNLIHTQYVIKIDFILRKSSSWQESVFRRRKKIKINGIPIWLISPEDLILAKLFWAKDSMSEFQLKDVINLLQSVESLDRTYLNKWVKDLSLQNIYQKVE